MAGSDLEDTPDLGHLGYQLFSATAGTLARAREQKTHRAIFVVHELKTPVTDPQTQRENAKNLADFVEVVFGLDRPDGDAWIVGPVRCQAATDRIPDDIDLWIGHLITE